MMGDIMRVEALVQLKTGDAVRGVISHRAPWFRYLRVEGTATEKVHVIEAKSQQHSTADGALLIPKANVLFLQQITRVTA
jgi:hypothetical protein